MIGYFEGIDSERGLAWRCADSYSLRDFLRLSNRDKVPDHSWLSRTRSRLPHEAHEKVFGWVLKLVAKRGLVKGERLGVDGSTMEANAALRTIVRRDSGESYREMLRRMAQESGIETPSAEDLARFDRKRKGKTLSNANWKSPIDPDAKIAKMKDGTTHLAYKPEHAVDLDTGVVVVAAPIHPADAGDTTTLAPTQDEPCAVAADKGYHAREPLKALEGGVWKTRIADAEPGCVCRRQRNSVAQSHNGLQEACDLVGSQNGRQLFRLPPIDDPLERILSAHRDAIEESQCASRLIDVGPGALLADEMKLIGSDILDAETIWRCSKMPAELSDRVDVGLLGRLREVADRHVFDHALAKWARRSHRGPPVVRGGGCDDHILSDGRLHLSPFPPAPKEQVRSIPGRIASKFARRANGDGNSPGIRCAPASPPRPRSKNATSRSILAVPAPK
jgi:IS5 family transposase